MKAISLWQPWAHLIAIGAKEYETRSWTTAYRGPMAIHASVRWTVRMAIQCYEEPFFTILSQAGIRFPARCTASSLPRLGFAFGAVIAIADLVDIVPTDELLETLDPRERAFGDFSHGRWAWEYANVRRLTQPVLAIGRQGLFNLDGEYTSLLNE